MRDASPGATPKRCSYISPLSCEPPAGSGERLEENQNSPASLVNCIVWLGADYMIECVVCNGVKIFRRAKKIKTNVISNVNPMASIYAQKRASSG